VLVAQGARSTKLSRKRFSDEAVLVLGGLSAIRKLGCKGDHRCEITGVKFRAGLLNHWKIWWPGTELNHSVCPLISNLLIPRSAQSAYSVLIADPVCVLCAVHAARIPRFETTILSPVPRSLGYECNHQRNPKTMRGAKSNALFLRRANWNRICPCVALAILATSGTVFP
jgi:hypothetical protein